MTKKACSSQRSRFFSILLLSVAILVGYVGQSFAVCPPGTTFRRYTPLTTSINITNPDKSINEGGPFVATMDMAFPTGAIALLPSGHGYPTAYTTTLNYRIWRLRVRRPTTLTAADLIVTYTVTGSNGVNGVLSSVSAPASQMAVTVIPLAIQTRIRPNRVRFRGFIELLIDYSAITIGGAYTGTITSTVDCP